MDIIFDQVNKSFGNKKVINNFSYTFKEKSYAIIGDNGSGKTTFLKLISTLIAPSSGKINFYYQNNLLTNELAIKNISFAAPYQELIEEMDINALLRFHFKFKIPLIENDKLIKKMGLYDYKKKQIYQLSSGIKQRLKLMIALNTTCQLTLLDEPTTNLDDNGKNIYYDLFKTFKNKKSIIIATNNKKDIVDSKTELIKIS